MATCDRLSVSVTRFTSVTDIGHKLVFVAMGSM